MRWPAALLVAAAALAGGVHAQEAPLPVVPPPPVAMPPPPPPPPPVVLPRPPRHTPGLMDELRTQRDLRETERHLRSFEERRLRGELDAGGARELNRLRDASRRLRRR